MEETQLLPCALRLSRQGCPFPPGREQAPVEAGVVTSLRRETREKDDTAGGGPELCLKITGNVLYVLFITSLFWVWTINDQKEALYLEWVTPLSLCL